VRIQAVSVAAAKQTTGESSGRSRACQHLNRQINILLYKFMEACAKHKIPECQILKIKSGGFIIPSLMESEEF
jgi:hypothetical protein